MGVYDPMLDYTVSKLKDGIKELRRLDKHSDYASYAPRIAEAMLRGVKDYSDYLNGLVDESTRLGYLNERIGKSGGSP